VQVGSQNHIYKLDFMLTASLEYPLSACIAAEWSSTEARGRMLAAVFLMQPLGQLCAYGAGLTAMQIFDGETPVDVDKQWRYVVGIGTLPTLLALGFRLFMPESGMYSYFVLRTSPHRPTEVNGTVTQPVRSDPSTQVQNFDDEDEIADQISLTKVWQFLFRDGHWTDLFGTSMCWALLDFAFCKSTFIAKLALSLGRSYST
jgi:PHS family inorganic phosphate transporter-like MFS transporter